MSQIRITGNYSEFGQTFSEGQLVTSLSPLHDLALVSSGLAAYANSGNQAVMPDEGIVPITSVQFANPAQFGLAQYSRRFYEFNGIRWYWDGSQMVAAGNVSLTVVGSPSGPLSLGQVLNANLRGGFASGFQWYRTVGGVTTAIPGANNINTLQNGSTYTTTASDVVPGTEVTVRITGFIASASAGVAAATAPTTQPPVLSTATPATGSLVSATAGATTGIPAPTVTLAATVNGVPVALPYTPTVGDAGKTLVVTQTVTNAAGTSVATVSALIAAAPPVPVAPVNTVLPTISGTAQVGQLLSATTGTWTSSTVPTYAYAWRRGATVVSTASTYVPVVADIGSTLTVGVVATNGVGPSTESVSVATAAVIAAALDTRPRAVMAAGNSFTTNPAGLLASMTVIPGSTNGGKAGNINLTGTAGQFGWVAVATTSPVLFTFVGLGNGGWFGNGTTDTDNQNPTTSNLTYVDGNGTTWKFFRSDYAASPQVYTLS